jgi:hypothetical protein
MEKRVVWFVREEEMEYRDEMKTRAERERGEKGGTKDDWATVARVLEQYPEALAAVLAALRRTDEDRLPTD